MSAMFRKLFTILPRHSLLQIYKTFMRPHLDYSDVTYDEIFYKSWNKSLNRLNTMLH